MMGAFSIWTIVGIVALAFIVSFIFGRIFFGKKQAFEPLANMNMPLVEDRDVEELVRSGRKIEAIKRYREETGVGLKEAKEVVERMEKGMVSSKPVGGMKEAHSADSDESSDSFGGSSKYSSSSLDDEIRDYIRAGQKINAIKRYREATGVGLKEAKDVVERIEGELRRG